MVRVNGVEMPLAEMSGVMALEDPSGHQRWALIVDATVEYGDAEFTGHESPQMKVIATMKPGELLRTTSTEEADEENVLVYSRMLVHILREERDRYAELERQVAHLRRELAHHREIAASHREERFKSMELGSRVFPPEGTEYVYAVKSEARFVGEPWAVVHKDPRPMEWHDDEWMAASGFTPEGGW